LFERLWVTRVLEKIGFQTGRLSNKTSTVAPLHMSSFSRVISPLRVEQGRLQSIQTPFATLVILRGRRMASGKPSNASGIPHEIRTAAEPRQQSLYPVRLSHITQVNPTIRLLRLSIPRPKAEESLGEPNPDVCIPEPRSLSRTDECRDILHTSDP
jgi:hypothetical protein